MKHPLLAATAVAASAILILSGCSGSGDSNESYMERAQNSPLAKYWEQLNTFSGLEDADFDALNVKSEEIVAECMKDEGFEYKPTSSSSSFTMGGDEDGAEYGTRKYAETYGYGASQNLEMMNESSGEDYVDPNQDYLDELSDSEREAYYEALSGKMPTEEEQAEMEAAMEDGSYISPSWEEQGCQGLAQHEVYNQGNEDPWSDPANKDLMDSMSALYEKTNSDKRVKEATKEWASCMADAGHSDLKERSDASNAIWNELSELQGGGGMVIDGGDGGATTFSSEDSGDEYEEPTPPTEKEISDFKKKEIAMAVDDFDCAKKFDLDNIMLDVQYELEEAFIAEHKTELDALVAKYGKDDSKSKK